MYFLVLFGITMRNQIAHMLKHGYIPISFGKTKYGGGKGKSVAAAPQTLSGAEAAAKSIEPRFTGSNLR
jgi:hypothetical protein